MNAIALDVGDRYIGVAAMDHTDAIAYRYATIDRNSSDALAEITTALTYTNADTLVIGVPYHIEDGSETLQTTKTRDFIGHLRASLHSSLQIVELDETLTSREARRMLKVEGADPSEEHAEAARILLQEFLIHST